MSDTSPILSLPYLMPSQAQKHVTHNEALQILDALVQLRVTAFDTDSPPANPVPGAAWALGSAPTGAWAGQADRLAIWQAQQVRACIFGHLMEHTMNEPPIDRTA